MSISSLDRPSEVAFVRMDRRHIWSALGIAVVTALLLGAIFAARVTLFSDAPPTSADLVEGRASPATILASERVTFASPLNTARAQDQAELTVADVYDAPDANIAREQVRRAARLIEFLDTLRTDPYGSLE